jgi:hypothetical protein
MEDEVERANKQLRILVRDLPHSPYLPDDLLIPVNALASECRIGIDKIQEPVLARLVRCLIDAIKSRTQDIPKILEVIHRFIGNPVFSRVFENIVMYSRAIPDYFLLELLELRIDEICEIFASPASRLPLFTQCQPLFHRAVFTIIDGFCSNFLNLDALLNSIRTTYEQKHVSQVGVGRREFSYYINLKGISLSQHHHEICGQAAKDLIELCCECQGLFDDLCCILRDLWERTLHPLLSALRLEIAYNSQSHGVSIASGRSSKTVISDPFEQLSFKIFEFFDTRSSFPINEWMSEKIGHSDLIFIARDPLLRYLMLCLAFSNIIERLHLRVYRTFDDRNDLDSIMRILLPTSSLETLEDVANNIEAAFLAFDFGIHVDDIVEELLKEAVGSEDVGHLVLFLGLQFIRSRQNPNLILEAAKIRTAPDVVVALKICECLSLRGLVGQGAKALLDLLVGWSRDDRHVLFYFLALLIKMANSTRDDKDIVDEYVETARTLCTNDLEQQMVDDIAKAVKGPT